jgi:hypothetical protein
MNGLMTVPLIALISSILVGPVSGQASNEAARGTASSVPKMIAEVNEGSPATPYYVEQLVHLHAVQAIPTLEQKFASPQDEIDKMRLASALVRLGDKNPSYWEYLFARAQASLKDEAPSFLIYDSDGKSKPGPSPEFRKWADAHHVSIGPAAQDAIYSVPAKIGFLAQTMDRRAIPLLRQALLSPNYMVEVFASLGLAKLEDRDSIPLIIEACRRAPAEAASSIAESLVYFDDPDAQSTVDIYLPQDRAKAARQARSNGKKPLE